MIKGSSRQVIFVKAPEETLFDQAIFLVKEDALEQPGVTAESVLAQAKKATASYAQKQSIFHKSSGVPVVLWMLLTASGTSVLWALALYFLL